ncbi:MAG: dihydrofolate reductase [Eubacterium sp.]|nr:dihydrofolate reductase [Eubacterium sp.]
MKLIAAVDKNWAIGLKGKLLVSIPEDMKFFRKTTMGHVVVMGRKTLESFPGGRPLSDRVNIVLTGNKDYDAKGGRVVNSLEELDEVLSEYDSDEVYVIGGQSIYELLCDRCDTALITKVNYSYQADAWFPNLDKDPDWELAEESEESTYFDLEYRFLTYKKH